MIVNWFGHSCFFLRGSEGPSILVDPFNEDEVGYIMPRVRADIVLISHDHKDHNNVSAVLGHPKVIRVPGRHVALGIEFLGLTAYHDEERGRLRGENIVFSFKMDGIRVCHLGDLGHSLSQAQAEAIGPVDLLFLPVGGIYTIDARGADAVMRQLNPVVAVPMHYKTKNLSFELNPVDDFLVGRKVVGPMANLKLTREDLDERRWVALLSCPDAGVAADR